MCYCFVGSFLCLVFIYYKNIEEFIFYRNFFLSNLDFLRPVLICIMVVIQNYKCICFQSSMIQKKKCILHFLGSEQMQTDYKRAAWCQKKSGCTVGNMLRRLCYPNHLSTGIFLVCMMNTNANLAELDQKSIWLPWQCAVEGSVWSCTYWVLSQSWLACGSKCLWFWAREGIFVFDTTLELL